jgi:prepilin-type N-terminal cleavage/methylation domain-containing protein
MSTSQNPSSRRRGFSLIEMLVALTISATLLTATLGALNAMFKGYEQTTDSAATHVVARIALNRVLGMIRTGSDFGPFPNDVLSASQNPLNADYFEYVSARDSADRPTRVTRIAFRHAGVDPPLRTWAVGEEAPSLGYTPTTIGEVAVIDVNVLTGEETIYTMLSGVSNFQVTLEYDVGPRLMRATLDFTAETAPGEDIDVRTGAVPQTVRLVASAMPRRSILE